jgi:hypothetical protein
VFKWTLPNRIRLGAAIRASLDYNRGYNNKFGYKKGQPGWLPDSERALAAHVGFGNHVALSNLINHRTQKCNSEVLEPIAPYIYRVIHFIAQSETEIVDVKLDYARTYAGAWKDLAELGENAIQYDLAIAPAQPLITPSELKQLEQVLPIIQRIVAQRVNLADITQLEILSGESNLIDGITIRRLILKEMRESGITDTRQFAEYLEIPENTLKQLIENKFEQLEDDELISRLCAKIPNENGELQDYLFWAGLFGIEMSENHHTNGLIN